jgi:hypothetical protein
MKIKLLQLGKGVCQYYRKNVKGNQLAPLELIQKKLTRNTYLALKLEYDSQRTLYLYGNLHIWVKGNTIYKIKNMRGGPNWFYKDEKKYEELNELLGIKELEAALRKTA